MSIQIAVRLPDDLVAFVDDQVGRSGGSRAAVVATALSEMRRQQVAERDAQIIRDTGDYPDFVGLRAFPVRDLSELD